MLRHLVSFVFGGIVMIVLSSCGGGGGGGSPTPDNVIGISFEAHVQDATLEDATDSDKRGERAKDENGQDVADNTDVVVRDATLPSSSGASSGGLVGFALPAGGCRVINNGVYENYLVSYRQGTNGELECESTCSGDGVVTTATVLGYKLLLCVHTTEFNRKLLVVEATDCSGEAGFLGGKCTVQVFQAAPCRAAGDKVLQNDGSGCQSTIECFDEGYKVDTAAGKCVNKIPTDCGGRDGFDAGKCVMPDDLTSFRQCLNRGNGWVLNAVGLGGCQLESDCTNAGYRVDNGFCRVQEDVRGCDITEVLTDDGRCAAPINGGQCRDKDSTLLLSRAGDECQTAAQCAMDGYKVVGDECVDKVGADCTGAEGLASGRCVTAQIGAHCTSRGDFVLSIDADEGCQPSSECTGAGNTITAGVCVASTSGDETDTPEVSALLSAEDVDKSFDEAFQDKPTRSVDFCIIGSGTTANNMARVSNTITDDKACQHKTINSPRDARRAFASNEVARGSLVAFSDASVAFANKGLNAKRLQGYKAFIPTGDNGIGDFLDDPTYTAKTKSRIRAALLGGDTFAVGRLNAAGDGRHVTSNGCGKITNCVLANGAFTVNGSAFEGTAAATAYVAASIARAMAYVPSSMGVAYVNVLFDKAKVEHNGISVFNPLRLIDAVREIPALQDFTEEDFESASAATKSIDTDDIYRALMRAQYAAVGRAGVPTQMDDISVDVTEFGETRAFTMPATSYRYRALPTPTHSPLFGMLGMVYREDARYPEVGIAFNDKQGRTFMSASHYRSEDFFGAYGSGAFKFAHVDNYRVVGSHEVMAGLDVTLWGRCGVVRDGGVLLDGQRGCDSGAGVSYAHEFMGFMPGEMTWRAEGARFLGGSLSSSGRRYTIAGGATQGEASVQLRFNW